MSTHLLIYEEIPEKTTYFVFTDPTPLQVQLLRDSHGTFINTEMDEEKEKAADALSVMLDSKPKNMTAVDPTEVPPFEIPVTAIYFAGFAM
jgi:hypothetical protein